MPVAKEVDKQFRVSNLVKHYEELVQPSPKKVTTLVRDVRRRKTGLEFCKKFKETYLQKFETWKYTTWHVRSSIFLGNYDKSNNTENNTYATNSTPALSSNQSAEDENIGCKTYTCFNEIILKKQCESAQNDPTTNGYNKKSKNGLNNKDFNDSSSNSTKLVELNTSMDDDSEIILRHQYNSKEKNQSTNDKNEKLVDHEVKNKYFKDETKLNLDTATGDAEDCIHNEAKIGFIKQHLDVTNFNDGEQNADPSINISDRDVSRQDSNLNKDLFTINSEGSSASGVSTIMYSDTADSVRTRNNKLVDEQIERSSSVVSWIKASYFSDNLENTPPASKCDQSSQTEHKLQEQKKKKLMEVKDPENNRNEDLMNGYENIEIYRQNVQKEINLIENINILDDDDDEGSTETLDNAEDHYQEIPEIQYVNTAEILMQHTSRNVDQHKLVYISNNNFNIDEVDISNKGIFGKGRCTIKIRTSYLEVINPMRNKKAPDQFFNEVYFLTSIPIDIAKYINKNKYNSRFDGSVNDDLAFHVETRRRFRSSLDTTFRTRCVSNQSVGTVDSDDFLQHITDYNSSTEDVQPNTSDLIRTASKLIRVDQTYYNNTLRITRNVVVEELTRVKPKSEYILDELLTTEFNNLSKLEYVRDYYMPEIQKITNNFRKNAEFKSSDLFLNWHAIYREACNFYERIEACGYNYEQLAKEILMSRNLFEEYSNYCKNKAQAERNLQGDLERIVEIVQERLGDKLGLSSYLLQPIQRLTKYKLLLEALKKELIEAGESYSTLTNAIDMITRIISESNDCIDASYIKDLPFKLGDQGKIIRKDTFNVVKVKPKAKWMDMKIFLFENVLIITAPIKFLDGYIYKDHIFMEHMEYHSCDIRKKFIISDYMQNKKANDRNYKKFICTHKSKDVATEWENLITDNLTKQFCILKDLASSNMVRR